MNRPEFEKRSILTLICAMGVSSSADTKGTYKIEEQTVDGDTRIHENVDAFGYLDRLLQGKHDGSGAIPEGRRFKLRMDGDRARELGYFLYHTAEVQEDGILEPHGDAHFTPSARDIEEGMNIERERFRNQKRFRVKRERDIQSVMNNIGVTREQAITRIINNSNTPGLTGYDHWKDYVQ